MAREMNFHALRQQSFPPPLAASGERSAATLRAHARAETVLLLARPFRWLIGAFHMKTGLPANGSRYSRSEPRFVNAARQLHCLAAVNME